ncbi:MAG: hypothetical protein ACHQ9S_08590 [Candidatus Binatia bacterium]
MALLVVATCVCVPARAPACGPFPVEARFWLTQVPNEPLERYLDGHLGILDPALGRAYKYVAYRHLSGVGLGASSQAAVARYWEPQEATTPYSRGAISKWEDARRQVPGVGYPSMIFPYRDVTRVVGGYTHYSSYVNCLDDSFLNASNALTERIGLFGANSAEVREWLAAQDQVFSNCQHGESIPEPLPKDRPLPARADREYQIAAAHFYAGHFEQAEQWFRHIAPDRKSPWSTLSAYLVARAIVRQGTLAEPVNRERLSAADTYLRELLADSSRESVHPAAQRLLDYVRVELDPAARQHELAALLSAPSLNSGVHQTLSDYLWLLNRHKGLPESNDELADWLAGRGTLDRWSVTHSLLWLSAAMMNAPEAGNEILQAAAQVATDSPGYLTVSYHRARLLAASGRVTEARGALERLLQEQAQTLSLGDRNRILSLRASLATNLEDFLAFAQQVPVEVGIDDDRPHLYTHGYEEFVGKPLFSDATTRVVDLYFTPGLALQVLRRNDLPLNLKRRLALTALVRALLTADDAVAADLSPLARTLAPELGSDLQRVGAAPPGPARQFATALMLLRFPGLQPTFGTPVGRVTALDQIDSLRDNWWCLTASSDLNQIPAPGLLTAEQRAAAEAMQTKLKEIDAAPIYFGRIVLEWARTHPHDPRLPEALHRVVKATRFGCVNDDGVTSKSAFQLLRRRYAQSPWAAKTPYWFR